MKGIKEFYDRTVMDLAERWYSDDSQLPLLKMFLNMLLQKPRVLDLCCGAGYESMRMARLGAEVVGIDISPESIAVAKAHNPQLEFHVGDMLDDYTDIGLVDGIVCIAGLVHIPVDKAPLAFKRMGSVLKTGGHLLLAVREGEGRLEELSLRVIDGKEYDRAFYGYTQEMLIRCADGIMEFVTENPETEPSPWRNYIFRKV